MSDEDLQYRIAKLEPKPGDALVFTTSKMLDRDHALHLRETILRLVPDIRVLICDGGAEITLMPADELRRRLGET